MPTQMPQMTNNMNQMIEVQMSPREQKPVFCQPGKKYAYTKKTAQNKSISSTHSQNDRYNQKRQSTGNCYEDDDSEEQTNVAASAVTIGPTEKSEKQKQS